MPLTETACVLAMSNRSTVGAVAVRVGLIVNCVGLVLTKF
jgi:hypothetical protein